MDTTDLFDEDKYGDWHEAFSAAGALAKRPEIASVAWSSSESPEGCGSCEIRGVFEMKTGGFGALNAWCDTTGWDCQSGGTWTDCKTEEEAYVFARK